MKKLKIIRNIALSLALSFSIMCSATLPDYTVITAPSPKSDYGEISRLSVKSESLQANIIVDIWTPANYTRNADTPYPAVYALDGQNMFDPAYCFANVAWAVDKACSQLAANDDFIMPVIVAINNRGSANLRPNDYFPEKALNYIEDTDKDKTQIYKTCANNFLGDEHAAFVATELKPLIDSLYKTDTTSTHTFAMGSSMGALASLYLMCEYIGSLDLNEDYSMNDDEVCANAILDYLRNNLPESGTHRLYMDQGTKDWDAGYLKYEEIAREIVKEHGYTEDNKSLKTYTANGAGHNEWYWQQRARMPLRFILSKTGIEAASIDIIVCDREERSDAEIYDIYGRLLAPDKIATLKKGLYISNGKKIAIIR